MNGNLPFANVPLKMWVATFELPQSGELIVHLFDDDEDDDNEVDDGNFIGELNLQDEKEDALVLVVFVVVLDGLFVVLNDFVEDDCDEKSEEVVWQQTNPPSPQVLEYEKGVFLQLPGYRHVPLYLGPELGLHLAP